MCEGLNRASLVITAEGYELSNLQVPCQFAAGQPEALGHMALAHRLWDAGKGLYVNYRKGMVLLHELPVGL